MQFLSKWEEALLAIPEDMLFSMKMSSMEKRGYEK